MEDPKSTDDDDHFEDCSDEFPFYDCLQTLEYVLSSSDSPLPISSSSESTLILSIPKPIPETPSSAGRRHRRSLSHRHRPALAAVTGHSNFSSSVDDENFWPDEATIDCSTRSGEERKRKFSRALEGRVRGREKLDSNRVESSDGGIVESVSEEKRDNLTVASPNNDHIVESGATDSSSVREGEGYDSNLLVYLATLVIKAIGYQFKILISFITFPAWLLYWSYTFLVNPFQTLRRARDYLIGKLIRLCNLIVKDVSPFLSESLKEHKFLLQLVLRCGWGLFWSVYVCTILLSLLVSAFVIGGFMKRSLIEEPFRLKQVLNFDYTKSSPVAFVPIRACPPGIHCDNCVGKTAVETVGPARVIPFNHKLQATVELTLPESDYNRNLGMFQVKVEFLSINGRLISSSSHPCMLQFKSGPIRLLMTFSKIVSLLVGHASESQTLKLSFRGFTERDVPTACLKVTIERRAEFRTGAGIPELYDAFLLLESELPFFKRMLWKWKTTIYVWLSLMVLIVELLFALVCCRPLLIPRAKPRSRPAEHGATQSRHGVQR
ncbi:hypothetical protein Nepgr_017584 [Nepenthes gracilis]|uniref:Seipin n=1 Tax=Nepenthes gracilis TaxID=150966 RepID=A0AAD3SQM9_NEPGR|nr:hypothetical protein Nepgr_017584 [Nepenthes gracilis]